MIMQLDFNFDRQTIFLFLQGEDTPHDHIVHSAFSNTSFSASASKIHLIYPVYTFPRLLIRAANNLQDLKPALYLQFSILHNPNNLILMQALIFIECEFILMTINT